LQRFSYSLNEGVPRQMESIVEYGTHTVARMPITECSPTYDTKYETNTGLHPPVRARDPAMAAPVAIQVRIKGTECVPTYAQYALALSVILFVRRLFSGGTPHTSQSSDPTYVRV
jgi:hypothetical protein